MELTLSPELVSRIQRKVDSGKYESADQLLEVALDELEQKPTACGMTAAELQALVDESMDEIERGEFVTETEARAHLARVRAELERA